jgi:hypothetical protein
LQREGGDWNPPPGRGQRRSTPLGWGRRAPRTRSTALPYEDGAKCEIEHVRDGDCHVGKQGVGGQETLWDTGERGDYLLATKFSLRCSAGGTRPRTQSWLRRHHVSNQQARTSVRGVGSGCGGQHSSDRLSRNFLQSRSSEVKRIKEIQGIFSSASWPKRECVRACVRVCMHI